MGPSERWRTIPGFPDYRISSQGQVERQTREKGSTVPWWERRKATRTKAGYMTLRLRKPPSSSKQRVFKVHRLVLLAFVGPCPKGMYSCHNNGVKDDNRLENLRWDTPAGNAQDKVKHGTSNRGGWGSKLLPAEVKAIRERTAQNESNASLGREYRVAASTISAIKTGTNWAWLE